MPPAKSLVFMQLRPICSQLLLLKKDANLLAKKLRQLLDVLALVDKQGLQACQDYITFPLFILLDATLAFRGKLILTKLCNL